MVGLLHLNLSLDWSSCYFFRIETMINENGVEKLITNKPMSRPTLMLSLQRPHLLIKLVNQSRGLKEGVTFKIRNTHDLVAQSTFE
jgi:hypothetical protein